MDVRTYLEIESGMMARLYKTWAPQAAAIYAKMTKEIAGGNFDAARALVDTIDLKPAAEANREYLKYSLWAFAVFGAAQASQTRSPLFSNGKYDETLNHTTTILIQSIALNGTEAVQDKALQLIANSEAEYGVAQKADKPRFLDEFVSFASTGNERMQMLATLQASRLSTWGFTAEADLLGFSDYRLDAVLDGRTSAFCRIINGHVFRVEDAHESITRILKVENPDDLKTVQPWPKQTTEALKTYKEMTAEQLTAAGLHIPPFHPGCRTLCVRTAQTTVLVPKETTATESSREIVTESAFDELKSPVTQAQLDYWNSYVGVSPVKVLSELSGLAPKDLLDSETKGLLKFTEDGEISMRARIVEPRIVADANAVFDPFTGTMYANFIDFKTADPKLAALFFRRLHVSMMKTSTLVGAEIFTVGAGGSLGIYTYSKLGYTAASADWYSLKEQIQIDLLQGGALHDEFLTLTVNEQKAVTDLLESSDPKALVALVDLPFRIDGQPIGKILLAGKSSPLSVKPDDPDVLKNLGEGDA
jgi:hypothetical protein